MSEEKKYVVILSTVPNLEIGRSIAKAVVEDRLAACVNILPSVVSIYEWQGKIEEESELMLVFKTRSELVQSLTEKILEIHPYDCPEVISIDIQTGSQAYLDWISEVVGRSGHGEDTRCIES